MRPSHNNPHPEAGFSLPAMFAALTLASLLGVAAVRASSSLQAQAQLAKVANSITTASAQQSAVARAAAEAAALATESSTGYPLPPEMVLGVGGPVDGGRLPSTISGADTLGYCAWSTGPGAAYQARLTGSNSPTAPSLAVISPGADGTISTTCAQIAAGQHATGDDLVVSYTAAQLHAMTARYTGPSVATVTALAALDAAMLVDGDMRLVRESNRLYAWSASAGWQPVGGAPQACSGAECPPPVDVASLVASQLRSLADGSAVAPSIAFAAAQDTGLFRTAEGFGVAVAGMPRLALDSTGATVACRLSADTAALGAASITGSLAVSETSTMTGAMVAAGGISTSTLTATHTATVAGLRLVPQLDVDPAGIAGQLQFRNGAPAIFNGTAWVSLASGLIADNGGNLVSSNVSGIRVTASSPGALDGITRNVLIGEDAGRDLGGSGSAWATGNVALGRQSLTGSYQQEYNTASDNVVVGGAAITTGVTSASRNVLVGARRQAGYDYVVSWATGETVLGYGAGSGWGNNVVVGLGIATGAGTAYSAPVVRFGVDAYGDGIGYSAGSGGIGYSAGSGGIGYRAGTGVVVVGPYAGADGAGVAGLLIGRQAGRYLRARVDGGMGGIATVGVGDQALLGLSTSPDANSGGYNTAVGVDSMSGSSVAGGSATSAITGSFNVALGRQALATGVEGSSQTALGFQAGFAPGGGAGGADNSTFVGSGTYATGGAGHTLVGTGAVSAQPGSFSTVLGEGASVRCDTAADSGCTAATVMDYAAAIGAGARAGSSNTLVLGRVDGDVVVIGAAQADTATTGYGRLQVHGAITPSADTSFDLGSGERRWRTVFAADGLVQTSDARLKADMVAVDPVEALEAVGKLRPVRYSWLDGRPGRKVGLLAQELVTVLPELVHVPTAAGDYYGVNYAELSSVLAAAIQDVGRRLTPVGVTQTAEGQVLRVNGVLAADAVRAREMEAERVKSGRVEAEHVQAKLLEAERLRTGEAVVQASEACQPVVAVQAGSTYRVTALGGGAAAELLVSMPSGGGPVQVIEHTAQSGVDLRAAGGQVCAVAPAGARVSWLRVL